MLQVLDKGEYKVKSKREGCVKREVCQEGSGGARLGTCESTDRRRHVRVTVR